MTDLVTRYLNAIRWNLPQSAKADDIVAELGDVLASRIEDREDALGRALTGGEVSTLLRDFGHPLTVAARYGKQQWLIGPEVFPFWLFTLKVVLGIQLVVGLVVALIQAIVGAHIARRFADMPSPFSAPTYPAPFAYGLVRTIADLPQALLGTAALITLIFAVMEGTGWLGRYLERWKPEQLPDLPAGLSIMQRPRSLWRRLFELAVGVAFLLWWGGLLVVPVTHAPMVFADGRLVGIRFSPAWSGFYWPILALAAANIVAVAADLLQPGWTVARVLMRTLFTLGGLVLVAALYQAGRLLIILPDSLDPVRTARIQANLDQSIHAALLLAALIWVWQWLVGMWRLVRERRR